MQEFEPGQNSRLHVTMSLHSEPPKITGLAIKATSARDSGGSVLETTGLESGDVMNAGYASQGRIDLRTNEDYESLCPCDRLKRPRSYILRCQSQLWCS